MLKDQHWKEFISLRFNAHQLGVIVQKKTQNEEQEIHNDQHQREPEHVLLSFGQTSAAQILLHHVLIQAGHDDGDQSP